ncbi:uncharacterized protein LOC120286005 [Eucalyptus grandis]|uniref:uncharacterized protein LOC120286005 n=1 Tax=Eucalyptus grandis TaxID=71139 RepID=UPI000524B924|nr:uncharacterized protein LOC120286005 [Eucalyptus grandis]
MQFSVMVVLVVLKGCLDETRSSQSKRMTPIAARLQRVEVGGELPGQLIQRIVRLMGCCLEDELLLVRDFLPETALKNHLFGTTSHATTQVTGAYGYAAPKYIATGNMMGFLNCLG